MRVQAAGERDSHDSVGSLVTEAQRMRPAAAGSKPGLSPSPGFKRSLRTVSNRPPDGQMKKTGLPQ